MTASRLSIPGMSLSASSSGAALAQAEQSALEQTDLAEEAERLIWQLDEQKQGDNSAARMVETLQADVPALEKRVKARMDEWGAVAQRLDAASASLQQLERAMAGGQTAGGDERAQYEEMTVRLQEWNEMIGQQTAALREDIKKWKELDALWKNAVSYATETLKLGEQSKAMNLLSALRSSLDTVNQQLDKLETDGTVWHKTANELEQRLNAVAEWLKSKPAAEANRTDGRSQPPLPSPGADEEGKR
ncbi:Chromosome partition protein Smc [Geobacillus sp. BCO2]|nr:Chromosome partition protein Smc [Geobacillus sp. BCO2]